MSGLVDCPGCLETVLPGRDGSCPACKADTRFVRAERVKVTLDSGVKLPPLCHACAAATNASTLVSRDRVSNGHWVYFGAAIAALAITVYTFMLGAGVYLSAGVSVALFVAGARKRASEGLCSITIRLPTCEACQCNKPPEPSHIDFVRSAMTFIVHRDFRRALPVKRSATELTA